MNPVVTQRPFVNAEPPSGSEGDADALLVPDEPAGMANGEDAAETAGDAGGMADAAGLPQTTRVTREASKRRKRTLYDRLEAFISKLSTRNNFWHRVCSLIWLPFAFRSGIKMKRVSDNSYTAILPFRRFNRNWYNAMAGAALLGNSEIAGGMYVFGVCGGDYTVVCKSLEYKFHRPCYGPAVYRITPKEDIKQHLAHGGEFNITLEMDVVQGISKPALAGAVGATGPGGEREKRVGRCTVTFHVTPKAHHKIKAKRASNSSGPAVP